MSWLARILGSERDRPTAPPRGDPARVVEVLQILEELRPMFVADGGDVELIAVDDGWVHVRLRGACTSCHASTLTLEGALEPKLRGALSWVRGVRSE